MLYQWLDDYRQFATLRQIEIIDAIQKEGTKRKAALAIGVSKSTIDDAISGLVKRAAKKAFLPSMT